jgi:hypothetical protein
MFKKKTVDSVISIFTKAIDDLGVIGAEQITAANVKLTEIERLTKEVDLHTEECARANTVALRLKKITEGV